MSEAATRIWRSKNHDRYMEINRESQRKYRQSPKGKSAFKEQYQQRKALGICVRCGKEDAERGRVLCWICKMNDRDRRVGVVVPGQDSEGWKRKREFHRQQMIAYHISLGHEIKCRKREKA